MRRNYQSKTLFFLPVLFLSIGLNRIDVNQEYWRGALNLTSGVKIGQTFKVGHNNLNMIKLLANNMKLQNKDRIVFHLKEAGQNNDLAIINLSGGNVGENFILRLQFTPIKDSAGKNFYFYLEGKEGESLTPIEIHYNADDVYHQGEAMVDGKPVPGDLFFRTYYRASFIEGLAGSLFDFKTSFLKEKDFAMAYLLTILGFGVLSAINFAKRKPLS